MKPFILSAYFLVFFVQTVFATETTFIAVDDANPPFMFQENGKAEGLYPALLQAIFSRMGVQAEIKAYPWKRALSMGEKGEVAIGGIYKTEERAKIYDYSNPVYTEKLLLYVKKGKSFHFKELQDLMPSQKLKIRITT